MAWNPSVISGVGVVDNVRDIYSDMHAYLAAAGVWLVALLNSISINDSLPCNRECSADKSVRVILPADTPLGRGCDDITRQRGISRRDGMAHRGTCEARAASLG